MNTINAHPPRAELLTDKIIRAQHLDGPGSVVSRRFHDGQVDTIVRRNGTMQEAFAEKDGVVVEEKPVSSQCAAADKRLGTTLGGFMSAAAVALGGLPAVLESVTAMFVGFGGIGVALSNITDLHEKSDAVKEQCKGMGGNTLIYRNSVTPK